MSNRSTNKECLNEYTSQVKLSSVFTGSSTGQMYANNCLDIIPDTMPHSLLFAVVIGNSAISVVDTFVEVGMFRYNDSNEHKINRTGIIPVFKRDKPEVKEEVVEVTPEKPRELTEADKRILEKQRELERDRERQIQRELEMEQARTMDKVRRASITTPDDRGKSARALRIEQKRGELSQQPPKPNSDGKNSSKDCVVA